MLHANLIDLARLKKLAPRIYSGTPSDRADWLQLYYRSGAWHDIGGDELHDRYGLTERTRDSCGEMGDCEDVMAEIVRRVDSDDRLGEAITEAEGPRVLEHWRELAKHATQPSLF